MKKSPTQLVVGGLIGATLITVAWYIVGWPWFLAIAVLLGYEGWTLVNQFPNDTISEIVWGFSKRPLVPFLGGAAFAWGLMSGHLGNPWLVAALAFLAGHFWFQQYRSE